MTQEAKYMTCSFFFLFYSPFLHLILHVNTITEGKCSRRSIRRVVCLQTKHLQENYQVWVNELKEIERRSNRETSNGGSTDESSTPVINASGGDQDLTEESEEEAK